MLAKFNKNSSAYTLPIDPSYLRQHQVCFFPQDESSLSSIDACVELIDLANKLSECAYYEWQIDQDVSNIGQGDLPNSKCSAILFGNTAERWFPSQDIAILFKRKLPTFSRVGLIGGAVFLSKEIGLNRDRVLSVHPNFKYAATEEALSIDPSNKPYSCDKTIHSAISGIAALHMMLGMIAQDMGEFVAEEVSKYVGISINNPSSHLMEQSKYLRKARGETLATNVLKVMAANIETPLHINEIARKLNISSRGLERHFNKAFNTSPHTVYREIRLDIAHQLIRNTDMLLYEIHLATGFASPGNFNSRYRDKYGVTPTESRRKRYGEKINHKCNAA